VSASSTTLQGVGKGLSRLPDAKIKVFWGIHSKINVKKTIQQTVVSLHMDDYQ